MFLASQERRVITREHEDKRQWEARKHESTLSRRYGSESYIWCFQTSAMFYRFYWRLLKAPHFAFVLNPEAENSAAYL